MTMWMQLKPFINPLTMTNQMASFAPDRIITDPSSSDDVAGAAAAGRAARRATGTPNSGGSCWRRRRERRSRVSGVDAGLVVRNRGEVGCGVRVYARAVPRGVQRAL